MHHPSTTTFRERLWEAASGTRDLLTHVGPARWEFFAKASSSVAVEIGPVSLVQKISADETGVAIRTFNRGLSGFAAGSGLGVDASRRALEGAASSECPVERDPLPPPHLLGTVEIPVARPPAVDGWADEAARSVINELAKISEGRLQLHRLVVRHGSFGWVLATAEGFVTAWEDASAGALAEVEVTGRQRGMWREMVHIPSPAAFDPAAAAARIASRAMLTLGRTTVAHGVKDLLLHPEVAAHLMAALASLFVVTPSQSDPLPNLLNSHGELASQALTLVDVRTDSDAPILAPCDGEGVATGRTLLLDEGVPRHRVGTYRDATACGEATRGGAVRVSYRRAPTTGMTNLRVECSGGLPSARLLEAAGRALYLLRPLAPVECDLEADTYRIIASGVWLDGGSVRGWHPVVELRGGLGTLLRRIDAVGTDRTWFDTPCGAVGAPSLLIRRQPIVG